MVLRTKTPASQVSGVLQHSSARVIPLGGAIWLWLEQHVVRAFVHILQRGRLSEANGTL